MKIFIVVGTRPEAIKMAPIIRALQILNGVIVRVCSTSQHKQMLSQVLNFFQIIPDYDLDIMEPNQTLSSLSSNILIKISILIQQEKPDWILVQGDTTTALAAALAGFHEKIKVAHIEAGLRSHNINSPFPEEMNRLVISKLATYHFCPTENAVNNLRNEGISENIFNVGNTVVDSVLEGVKLLATVDQTEHALVFKGIDLEKRIILVTCHRRESFGKPFENICKALLEIVDLMPNFIIIYPVHLNPNIINNAKLSLTHPRIYLIDPLPYPNFLWLLNRSELVLTDSGGIQEEAPSLGKPVLVLREVTERTEGIEAGNAILVGTSTESIVSQTILVLQDSERYRKMAKASNPYGDGQSAQRIINFLMDH